MGFMETETNCRVNPPGRKSPLSKQGLFQEILVGVLLYAVVFGFFNDYTDFLKTASYSTTFLAALLMMLLTFPTFRFKSWIAVRLRHHKVWMVISVWLVMFLSKFVFLGVMDIVFGSAVEISGVLGLVLIIACATVLQKMASWTCKKLGLMDAGLDLG
jgi:hypothetical protein